MNHVEHAPTTSTPPDGLSGAGRDALNLVEFPLALLSDRVRGDAKTLTFEDSIWDKGQRRLVARRLIITASDRFGLPTALDDEVILGLLQLSRQEDFADRRVRFTRRSLIRLLGWRDEGKSYQRLETSLKRWLGVTLYYERAWWDPRNQVWADKHFHLLDNLLLYRRKADCEAVAAASYFTWNQEVFESFAAGSLKQLDMDLYRSLTLPTSKRLYRFLDKRFYFASTVTFDLKTFAFEHVGLSRAYDCSQIRRRLQPAIDELVAAGFLTAADRDKTFQRLRRGAWRITLQRTRVPKQPLARRAPRSDQEQSLVQRGVSAPMAARLVKSCPSERIDEKVAIFDQLRRRNDRRASRNPSGYLVQSILDDYATPPSQPSKPPRPTAGPRQTAVLRPRIDSEEEKRIASYLDKLTENERDELEMAAHARATPLQLAGLRRAEGEGRADRIDHYRRAILTAHVRKLLKSVVS